MSYEAYKPKYSANGLNASQAWAFYCVKCFNKHYKAEKLIEHIKINHPEDAKQIFIDSLISWGIRKKIPIELALPNWGLEFVKASIASDKHRRRTE